MSGGMCVSFLFFHSSFASFPQLGGWEVGDGKGRPVVGERAPRRHSRLRYRRRWYGFIVFLIKSSVAMRGVDHLGVRVYVYVRMLYSMCSVCLLPLYVFVVCCCTYTEMYLLAPCGPRAL